MAEELVLDVKSNIKSVTKETKDWAKSLKEVNEQISIQESVITDLEKDLIKLKAQQDAIPKGAYVQGMDKLNRKIKETSTELKLEKIALKELTGQQKEASKEVKKSTAAQKENNKESKESIANFQFMGVSLNGVKKGFQQVIPTAKAMFGTIKAGIMSTGIGALVLAVVALTQSFKRSEAGQEKFQRIMAGIGAVTSQVLDLFSDLGETIIDAVTSPMDALKSFKDGVVTFLKNPIGTIKDVASKTKEVVKEFVDETKKEVDALDEVTIARQKAHRIDRELKVERAKANKDINDIRLEAEDRENKSATERIALLRKAQTIEEGITQKEIQSKKILIEAQKLEMAQGKNNIEAKDKLAQLQAELINLDTKKLRSQRLLQTQITTAIREEKALKEQAAEEAQADIDSNNERKKMEGEVLLALQQENTLALIEDLQERALAELKIQEDKEIASAELLENAELVKEQIRIKYDRKREAVTKKTAKNEIKWAEMTKEQRLDTAQQAADGLAKIAGEQTAAGKALAVIGATINTYSAATAALAPPPVGAGPILGPITAGVAIATGLSNIQKILSAGGGGGGGGGSISAPATAGTQPPAPQMMSGDFSIGGLEAPEPIKAFVVTDEMTSSQNQLADIRRRATI